MFKAKRDKVRNFKRETFLICVKEELPKEANVLRGRFLLAIKSTIDVSILHKVRFEIGGYREKLKGFMVHSSQTLQRQSIYFWH